MTNAPDNIQPLLGTSQVQTRQNSDMNLKHWIVLVRLLVARDLKVRYKGSLLGYLWSMLNPLLTMSVLAVVFSYAMRVKIEAYPIYLLSGLLIWNLFNQSISVGSHSFIGNAPLMKKVRIPSWVFPAAIVCSAAIHMFLAFVPYLGISLFFQRGLNLATLQFFPYFIILFLFIMGAVLAISSLNVFFRDVGQMIEPVLQIFFYATPIIYPLSLIPEHFLKYLKLNPMLHFVQGIHTILYSGEYVSPKAWLIMSICAVISLMVGSLIFYRSRDKFLYYI